MPDILVRGLDEDTVNRLKARAKRNHRSLQGELRQVLEQAAGLNPSEMEAVLDAWEEHFGGRRFADSADLVREDRDR